MKKTIVLVLTLVLAACLLCGCAAGTGKPEQQTNQSFHWAALAIRAWKPPMAMVQEAVRSASVG